jgi:hypothetical protein
MSCEKQGYRDRLRLTWRNIVIFADGNVVCQFDKIHRLEEGESLADTEPELFQRLSVHHRQEVSGDTVFY